MTQEIIPLRNFEPLICRESTMINRILSFNSPVAAPKI